MTDSEVLDCVAEFITTFDATPPWGTLVEEEAAEVVEAFLHLLKELADLQYVSAGAKLTRSNLEMSDTVHKAIRIFRVFAEATSLDIIDIAYKRVHESNMSKLGDDGKPIRREDGKILKGPNYKPPVLDDLIGIM